MPLQDETVELNRRAAKRWLAGSLALMGLVFAVPVIVPFAVPIEVKVGNRWLRIEAGAIPAVQQTWIAQGPGYSEVVGERTPVLGIHSPDPMTPVFITDGDYHWWWYRFAGVLYSVEIFDGERFAYARPINVVK